MYQATSIRPALQGGIERTPVSEGHCCGAMACSMHRSLPAAGFFGTQLRSPTAPIRLAQQPQAAQAGQKLAGTVVTVMQKTVTIEVTRTAQHPLYVKRVKKVKKFLAHDETNRCKLGDYVSFVPDRPRSARKRWQVADVIRQTAL